MLADIISKYGKLFWLSEGFFYIPSFPLPHAFLIYEFSFAFKMFSKSGEQKKKNNSKMFCFVKSLLNLLATNTHHAFCTTKYFLLHSTNLLYLVLLYAARHTLIISLTYKGFYCFLLDKVQAHPLNTNYYFI